ncbi:hypothetical protein B0H10DRAFT_2189249 [Mycena sp. CBHHK59/15]|nr:hypothetical protein B0H10DRAFT_2189249 [Mycena sp. CBHHK59/15]
MASADYYIKAVSLAMSKRAKHIPSAVESEREQTLGRRGGPHAGDVCYGKEPKRGHLKTERTLGSAQYTLRQVYGGQGKTTWRERASNVAMVDHQNHAISTHDLDKMFDASSLTRGRSRAAPLSKMMTPAAAQVHRARWHTPPRLALDLAEMSSVHAVKSNADSTSWWGCFVGRNRQRVGFTVGDEVLYVQELTQQLLHVFYR